MVFFEAVQALFSLDWGFFVDIFLNNLLWVFMFAALLYYFMEGKHLLYYFILVSVLMWAYIDFESITGFVWSAAPFLLTYYITKLAVLAWAEKSPAMKKNLVLISEVQFLSLLLIYTFFIK